MSETLSSGLTLIIPSAGDINWQTTIKNSCFQKISEHDHTGSGKGVQIATSAIADGAVTTAKLGSISITAALLASDAVTTVKILDLNVTTAKIAADAVTGAKILLGNNVALRARNAANSADVGLFLLNASNELQISIPGNVTLESSGAGNAVLITTSSTGVVGFNNVATRRWTLNADGHFIPGATNTYDLGISGQEIRNLRCRNIGTVASEDLRFFTGGTNQWKIESSTGAWQPETDNGLDIGASSAAVSRIYANRAQISADTAPASPTSGSWVLYADAGDSNKLKAKYSSGTVVTLGTP